MPKGKTMHELAKEFPDKTYRELETYRNADRQQEAHQIPLTESQQSQEDLEPIEKGICIAGEARKDREDSPKEKIKELEEALANALAVNAETNRGKAAGLYIERKIIKHGKLEDMSEQELEAKMKQILDDYAPILNVTPIPQISSNKRSKRKNKKAQKSILVKL